MILILEGPDGAGKSTLAHQLQQSFPDLQYHHEGPPPQNISPLDHYGRVLEDIRKTGKPYVMDRFALGERVYGPIYRGHDGLGDEGWKLIQRQIRACVGIQILCLPAFDVCHAAWSSGREEMYKGEDQYKQIYETYYRYQTGHNQFVYDYTLRGAFETLLLVLRPEAMSRKWRPGVIGSIFADYLFVGDQGSNPEAIVDIPFWGTNNSSLFLNQCLEKAGLGEMQIAFINARQVDGTINEIPRTNPLGHKLNVVALGQKAAQVCHDQRIEGLQEIAHPQYYKRFHFHQPELYVDILQQVKRAHAQDV